MCLLLFFILNRFNTIQWSVWDIQFKSFLYTNYKGYLKYKINATYNSIPYSVLMDLIQKLYLFEFIDIGSVSDSPKIK